MNFKFILLFGVTVCFASEQSVQNNEVDKQDKQSISEISIGNRTTDSNTATTTKILPAARKYEISVTPFTWSYSAELCAAFNMKLVSITSQEKNDEIAAQIKAQGHTDHYFWTSGSDQDKSGEFIWTETGEPFTYTNWIGGEPNDVDNADCVIMDGERGSYKWTNLPCSFNTGFICEKKLQN